ncbi:unnamed protein product [Cylindrotheca closterium]|uniref:Uncharacterized protein n=1 Tax=Cylindrotheca closterium TaxID=2856 RepID=A0AAD2FSJ0_9STRA|nr:unnamed protein product [Cylindrotheca closterium]
MTSFPKLLGPESPQMGTQFLSSVSICFSDDSIHQAIHDKKRPKKSEIQATFGFAVPTGKPYSVYGRGRKDSVTAETISADTVRFNAPQMLSMDKLRLLSSSRVGAVLGVFFTPNSPPVIGFGASPVSTTFNGQDAVHRWAPKWSDCFEPALIQQYWQGDMSVPTHSLVVSLSWKTRLTMPVRQRDFVQATKPAMLLRDFSKILLIPDGCGAPVGLYWPTSISFEDFKTSLSGHGTPYGSFLELLRSQSSIFEDWFTAVNSSAVSYQLQTTSAMDLWETLPCLHGDGLLNVAAAQPLREQFARYAIRQRCQVGAWLERARQCYPPALGYHSPPDHFAFLSVLCPPEDGWPWPEFSTWLSDLPFDALPDRYQRYEPKEIPVKARAVFVPAILVEKADPDSDLDAYANVFATTAPTVTATPNIAKVPAPAPHVATPSPPKEAPLPPVRRLASPPSVPQDVLGAMQKVRAFQETIVHGTSAGTPANPVDLAAGDVEEYAIRPNDLATRFASLANDSSTTAAMRAGNIADRRRSSLAQGRFGSGSRAGSLGLAPMRNKMFNPQTLAAALGVRQSRFVSADKASLASVQAHRTCSPYFLNVALVLASFFRQEEQPYLCLSDDRVVAATDWMKVPEPTQLLEISLQYGTMATRRQHQVSHEHCIIRFVFVRILLRNFNRSPFRTKLTLIC